MTLLAAHTVQAHYGKPSTRTLMVGGSNGGHHTKWMLESHPELYDGGIAGFGFNSQVSQWGSIATLLRHYDAVAGRIDDIIAARAADSGLGIRRGRHLRRRSLHCSSRVCSAFTRSRPASATA